MFPASITEITSTGATIAVTNPGPVTNLEVIGEGRRRAHCLLASPTSPDRADSIHRSTRHSCPPLSTASRSRTATVCSPATHPKGTPTTGSGSSTGQASPATRPADWATGSTIPLGLRRSGSRRGTVGQQTIYVVQQGVIVDTRTSSSSGSSRTPRSSPETPNGTSNVSASGSMNASAQVAAGSATGGIGTGGSARTSLFGGAPTTLTLASGARSRSTRTPSTAKQSRMSRSVRGTRCGYLPRGSVGRQRQLQRPLDGDRPRPAALAGDVRGIHVKVPAGWYLRLTVTNAVIGTTSYY